MSEYSHGFECSEDLRKIMGRVPRKITKIYIREQIF